MAYNAPFFPSASTQVKRHGQRKKLKKTARRFFPDLIFYYSVLDKELERMHDEEKGHWEIALGFATTVSVFPACLGLIGFAEYESERKTVEICIRKALGATRLEIAPHIIKDFLRIALLADAIAWPVSTLFMRIIFYTIKYPYPFHADNSIFLLAGRISLSLTLFTISCQTDSFSESGRCASGRAGLPSTPALNILRAGADR